MISQTHSSWNWKKNLLLNAVPTIGALLVALLIGAIAVCFYKDNIADKGNTVHQIQLRSH